MDARTLAYYEAHAAEAATRYESGDLSSFHPLLLEVCPPGSRVLDVGCGSGRDVAFLRGRGVQAYGVDASAAMVAEARRRHPEIAAHVRVDALPALGTVGADQYDAVLATAVLMHLPAGELEPAGARLARLLTSRGSLLISIPAGTRGRPGDHRDEHGRLFRPYAAGDLEALLEGLGLRPAGAWTRPDVCGRAGLAWRTVRFRQA